MQQISLYARKWTHTNNFIPLQFVGVWTQCIGRLAGPLLCCMYKHIDQIELSRRCFFVPFSLFFKPWSVWTPLQHFDSSLFFTIIRVCRMHRGQRDCEWNEEVLIRFDSIAVEPQRFLRQTGSHKGAGWSNPKRERESVVCLCKSVMENRRRPIFSWRRCKWPFGSYEAKRKMNDDCVVILLGKQRTPKKEGRRRSGLKPAFLTETQAQSLFALSSINLKTSGQFQEEVEAAKGYLIRKCPASGGVSEALCVSVIFWRGFVLQL